MEHDPNCEAVAISLKLQQRIGPISQSNFGKMLYKGHLCFCLRRLRDPNFIPDISQWDARVRMASATYMKMVETYSDKHKERVKLFGSIPKVGDRFTLTEDGLEAWGQVIRVDFKNRRRIIE